MVTRKPLLEKQEHRFSLYTFKLVGRHNFTKAAALPVQSGAALVWSPSAIAWSATRHCLSADGAAAAMKPSQNSRFRGGPGDCILGCSLCEAVRKTSEGTSWNDRRRYQA